VGAILSTPHTPTRQVARCAHNLPPSPLKGEGEERIAHLRSTFSNSSHLQMCAITPVVMTARGRPKLSFVPPSNEGARNAGCASASAAPCAKGKKHTSVVATVAPEASGVPHAVVLRLASCSPRERPLGCHRRLRGTFPLRSEVKRAGRISQDHTTWAGAELRVHAKRFRLAILRTAWSVLRCDDDSHALCTRNAPCYRRSRLTLPRHRIPPKRVEDARERAVGIVTIAKRPS